MSLTVTLDWYPEAFLKDVDQRAANGVNAAAGVLARQIAANVTIRPPKDMMFVGSRGGASDRGISGRGGSIVSMPGQYPSNQTGKLKASIRVLSTARPGAPTAIVGSLLENTTKPYHKYLEYGTPKMLRRPFIGPAIPACRSRMWSAFLTAAHGTLGSSPAASVVSRPSPMPVLAGSAR